MIERIASHEGRIVKVEGPAASGKTEALVRRCLNLVERGVAPESILVATPTANAAAFFRHRLARAAEERGGREAALRVAVMRAVEVCASVLDEPAARAQTGRAPRILADGEYLFLVEDLKTLGQKNRRLKNMLDFFRAQWSALEDEQDWLIPGEETTVLARMRDIMRLQGTMLRDEAPYLCARLLKSPQGASLAPRFDFVLCDDFHNLSYAEQTCMCLCARTQLVVCGNASHATRANTDYPNPKGFDRFDRTHRGVDLFRLARSFGPPEAARISAALDEQAQTEEAASAVREAHGAREIFVAWETPEEELASLACIVEAWCAHAEDARASDVCVAVPTKRWGVLARKALEARGVPVSDAGLGLGLGGDPRAEGRHDAISAYARLLLAADGKDMVAWRIWGGLDHALTNSDVWRFVYDAALAEGMPLFEAFRRLAAGDLRPVGHAFRADAIRRIWETGHDVIARASSLTGPSLARETGLSDSPALARAVRVESRDDAVALRDKVRAHLSAPRFDPDDDAVRVALVEATEGMQCPCLVMPGLVDGLIPHRDAFDPVKSDKERERALEAGRARLAACLPRGVPLLVASTFSRADLEAAERANMEVVRIASVEGRRTASVRPSIFLKGQNDGQEVFAKESTQALKDFVAGAANR